MFQFPGFALNPYGFRVQYLHLTLRNATPPVRVRSQYKGSKVGFPIRRSLDQSLFAAPQGISQRTTSFIASQRQGIHQMLLRHLIALMIHVRRFHGSMCFKPMHPRQEEHGRSERPAFSSRQRPLLLAKWIRLDGPAGAAAGGQLEMLPHRIHSLFTMSNTRTPLTQEQHACLVSPRGSLGTAPQISPTFPDNANTARPHGGARRDRTDDLMLAKHALSQLSYGPFGWPPRDDHENGGPGTTRTSDLTLIRGAL
jgi:hypothetical protein